MPLIGRTRKASHVRLCAIVVAALAAGGPVMAEEGERVDPLVGVWESVAPGSVDCQTRLPLPDAPVIRAVYTMHHGGTMSEENTDPIEGPYRSSGFGIWKRLSGRDYAAAYAHYGFVDQNLLPTKQLGAVVHARTSIRLNKDAKAFTENGTFEVFFPDPVTSELGDAVFSGCFAGTSHRLIF